MARFVPANRSNFWASHVSNGNQNSLQVVCPSVLEKHGAKHEAFWTHLHSATFLQIVHRWRNQWSHVDSHPMAEWWKKFTEKWIHVQAYLQYPMTGWLGDWVTGSTLSPFTNHFAWADSSGTNKSTNQLILPRFLFNTPPTVKQKDMNDWDKSTMGA
jgi:hypothetical protein